MHILSVSTLLIGCLVTISAIAQTTPPDDVASVRQAVETWGLVGSWSAQCMLDNAHRQYTNIDMPSTGLPTITMQAGNNFGSKNVITSAIIDAATHEIRIRVSFEDPVVSVRAEQRYRHQDAGLLTGVQLMDDQTTLTAKQEVKPGTIPAIPSGLAAGQTANLHRVKDGNSLAVDETTVLRVMQPIARCVVY